MTDSRLLSYGFGDGGGGPEFEMVEIANRLKDVEGLPRTEHIRVGDFMQKLEKESFRPSVYAGGAVSRAAPRHADQSAPDQEK